MRTGIIGAGGIANKLHLPQLAAMPEMQVTHIAGRKESRLRMLSDRFQVPRWTTDYRDVIADESVEAVVIAVPHPLHVQIGLEALAAGKHLLMQKPLTGSLDEARKFAAAVEASDRVVLALPHFGPDIFVCRRLVAEGVIGRPSGAHCRVSHGGPEVYYAEVRDSFEESGSDLWFFRKDEASVGALFDMGVYAVAALVAALGAVSFVQGMARTLDKPTELEDTATLLLEFRNGVVATAETGWVDPARSRELRIHGSLGKLTTPGHAGAALTRWEPGSFTREDVPSIPHALELSGEDRGNPHEHWLACIRAGRQPELSHVWAALHVTEVLLAGLESARTGRRQEVFSRPDPPGR